jgi:hypothetical protein
MRDMDKAKEQRAKGLKAKEQRAKGLKAKEQRQVLRQAQRRPKKRKRSSAAVCGTVVRDF